jgi:uncharacterized protein (DUF305 family)
MNKLTPIFIGGALVAAASLSYAQISMDEVDDDAHKGHEGQAIHLPAHSSGDVAPRAHWAATDKMYDGMTLHQQSAVGRAPVILKRSSVPANPSLGGEIIAAQEAK